MCNVCAKILTNAKHAYTHTKHRHEHTYTKTYGQEVNLQLYMRLCLQFNHSTRFIAQIPWQEIQKVYLSPPEVGKPHFLSYMDREDSAM